jgi:hypothetical protein
MTENNENLQPILDENHDSENLDIIDLKNTDEDLPKPPRLVFGSPEQLAQARSFRGTGGKMTLIIEKYKGLEVFIAENFVNKRRSKRMNAVKFREFLMEQYPEIPEEEVPSDIALRKWRVKYFRDLASNQRSSLLAMKDEVRIISVMQDFNFFEERMIMYRKSKKVLRMAEDILNRAYEISKKMNVPTSAFSTAISDFFKALEGRGAELEKLDSLAIRFGFMPPRGEKSLLTNNTQINNYTLSEDHQKIKSELGLNDDDFSDDKISETMEKILTYVGKSGSSILKLGAEKTIRDDEEPVISTESIVISEGDSEGGKTETVG